ncbi:MAG: major capsid protein [Microviridae sp.]|nr:MAG: major capsid protein [Microviridae sp.]
MSIFTQVQNKKVGSNTFDLSHDKKLSCKMGELVPIHCMEIVPGDSISMSTSQLLRMAPMIAPIMHQVNVYTHFFFVPNRILWPNWEKFITGGEDGFDETVFPVCDFAAAPIASLGDYLGLPNLPEGMVSMNVSALPALAYNKIYNEYYRDQNLINPVIDSAVDGENIMAPVTYNSQPYKRAWQHDYFTAALPWTQKGPEATIPLGDFNQLERMDGGEFVTGQQIDLVGMTFTDTKKALLQGITGTPGAPEFVKFSEATATSINDLRRAFKLQEWLEKNARGGSRYTESILSHFGVRSSDQRLQRPEYLGGGSSPMVISEVLQTSNNDTQETPQGNMAGHGLNVGGSNSFRYTAEEHGYIIGIMSIMPKPAYQQGVPKHFLKFDKFDYFWPSFAHLGEQPVENREIYLRNDNEDPTFQENYETFGYTPRYAEYKFINSSVHGEYKSTLDFWHMGRKFETPPALNKTFIECDPTTRIFAVLDSEQIYAHVYHRIKARRKMPYFGTPTM